MIQVEKRLKEAKDAFISNVIKDESFRDSVYLAGGCIRDLISGVEPKDWDLYCVDEATAVKLRRVLSKNISFNNNGNFDWLDYASNYRFNIICNKEFCVSPEDLIKEFNFTCNMNYFHDNKLVTKYLPDIMYKSLVFNRSSSYPLGCLVKLPRMQEIGYVVPEKEMFAMLGKVLILNIQTQEDFIKNCPNISNGVVAWQTRLPTAAEWFKTTGLGKELF